MSQAVAAVRRQQVVERGEPADRLPWRVAVVGLAEQADGVAELVQRRLAALPDVVERRDRADRVGVRRRAGDAGLDVDQGQVVTDAVVQVAGDPQPFLGDPAAGLGVPVGLGLRRRGADLGQVGPAVPGGRAGRDGEPAERGQGEVLRAEPAGRLHRRCARPRTRATTSPPTSRARTAVGVLRDGVEREQRRGEQQRAAEAVVVGQVHLGGDARLTRTAYGHRRRQHQHAAGQRSPRRSEHVGRGAADRRGDHG